ESAAGETDAAMRAQYEEYPYPARVPENERANLIVRTSARLDSVSHHCYGGRQDFRRFRVLAAGGGTGDSTIFWGEQLRGRGASEVVYLDLSGASMSIAQRRAEIRQLDNIRWVNDSLLNLSRLGLGQFDFIDCTGVLHHLEDPQAGLDALVSVLAPGGAMNLAVYGLYGRTAVYQVQELMRLVNAPEETASHRVANTRSVLESLPPYHWVNVAKSAGLPHGDLSSDAAVFDTFLHPRDRAYTITQVHELLDRSGLELAGEPGSYYEQLHYLPETFVRDPALRERLAHYPLRRRQAIAEIMSGRLSMHEFYAVRAGEGGRGAQVTDTTLVPWEGMDVGVPLAQIADYAERQANDFTVRLPDSPGKPLRIPKTRLTPSFLRLIDGQRSIAELYAAVKAAVPDASDAELALAFPAFFTSLNRGQALFLRHPDNPAFPQLSEMHARLGR
ncbi:MAG TPA: class I SAM-dependent methyltransferase, partial [Polyangia bacterium]|nr:class I SAM-dependent methyltransferase [Polyangia bacterium]